MTTARIAELRALDLGPYYPDGVDISMLASEGDASAVAIVKATEAIPELLDVVEELQLNLRLLKEHLQHATNFLASVTVDKDGRGG